MNLILASGSASRAQLLKAAGVAFEIQIAGVDEDEAKASLLREGADVPQIASMLAELKALRVSHARPGQIVIGADQALLFESSLLNKCESMAEAEAMLRKLRGKKHQLCCAAVLARDGMIIWRHLALIHLVMRNFSDAFLQDYLAEEESALLSAVGCYRFEGRGVQLFDHVDGDYFSVLGLPLLPLLGALRELGVIAK